MWLIRHKIVYMAKSLIWNCHCLMSKICGQYSTIDFLNIYLIHYSAYFLQPVFRVLWHPSNEEHYLKELFFPLCFLMSNSCLLCVIVTQIFLGLVEKIFLCLKVKKNQLGLVRKREGNKFFDLIFLCPVLWIILNFCPLCYIYIVFERAVVK